MHSSPPAPWLSELTAPLFARFGRELTLSRFGNAVRWGYDGQSAVIELSSDDSLRATFIDSERFDAVSARAHAAVYRGRSAYALNASGARCMAIDVADFFSGVREPAFTFIDAYAR